MLLKDFTHGVKEVPEKWISIVILKFQNKKNELFTTEFWQITFKNLHFLLAAFEKMWGAIIKWGKWSDTVDVRLPEIFWEIQLKKILPLIEFQREVVGWIM